MADFEARQAHIIQAWPDICARLAAGELVKDILKLHGITEGEKVGYLARDANARIQWDRAREQSAEAFMSEALEVARGMGNSTDAQGITRAADPHYDRRTHIDTLKWAARIRNPRAYSDKSTVDVNVRTVDLTRIIGDAQARLEASRAAGRVIEGEVIRVALPREKSETGEGRGG